MAPCEHVEILEHRMVLGNPPGPVHHRNGCRTDNRPENLEATGSQAAHFVHHRELDYEAIAQAYVDGHSTIVVAEMFGTHPGKVSRILRTQGVEARHPTLKGGMEDCRHEVLDALDAGATQVALGRKYGVDRGVIARILRDGRPT